MNTIGPPSPEKAKAPKANRGHRGIRDNKRTTTHQAASVKHGRPML
jgi:hypothetical protein